MPTPSLLQRLKERKLVQWALAYLAGAWVVVEATNLIVDQFFWPRIVGQVVTVLAFFGFFVALVLAWVHGEKGRHRLSRPELLLVTGVMIVAGVVLANLPKGGSGSGPTEDWPYVASEDDRPSIAVLPFDNFSPDPNHAYFADGIHEEVISNLSKVSALRVISRNSVMGYREERKPTRQIAAELGVGFLLEGSARIGGGTVRLTLQLIDGNTDTHLWSEAYDRPYTVEDFISTQTEVAQEVTQKLQVEITPEEASRISIHPTENREAFDLYLLGRHRYVSRSAENLRAAIRYFEGAIGQDSSFALAWTGIADAWTVLPWYEPVPSREAYVQGRDAARRALALDENLAEAHTALGGLALFHEWAWERAETHLLKAVELNPNYAQAHQWLATAHYLAGRPNRAVQSAQAGVRLNPLGNNIRFTLANLLYNSGRLEEAQAVYREAEKLEPPMGWGLMLMSLFFVQQGQTDEALRVIQRWGEVIGYPEPESLQVIIRATETPEFTGQALTALEAVRRTTGLMAGDLAALYLNLEAPEEALRIVQESIAQKHVFVTILGFAHTRAKVLANPQIMGALQEAGIPIR